MISKVFLLFALAFCSLKAASQPYQYVYYMDENLNMVTKDKATVLAKGFMKDGLLQLDCFDKPTGRKFLSASFSDSLLSSLQGVMRNYDLDGRLESEANYNNNEMDGVWKYWLPEGLLRDSMLYRNGVRIAYATYKYTFNQPVYSIIKGKIQYPQPPAIRKDGYFLVHSYTDSLANTFTEKQYSVKGDADTLVAEAYFVGNRGIYTTYDVKEGIKKDSVFSRELKEAQFPGGPMGWRFFLQRNLNPMVGTDNGVKEGVYEVLVEFEVDTDGTLSNVKALTNRGYGMEKEVIRMMKISPKWEPAVEYGRKVKAYRRQPVRFSYE